MTKEIPVAKAVKLPARGGDGSSKEHDKASARSASVTAKALRKVDILNRHKPLIESTDLNEVFSKTEEQSATDPVAERNREEHESGQKYSDRPPFWPDGDTTANTSPGLQRLFDDLQHIRRHHAIGVDRHENPPACALRTGVSYAGKILRIVVHDLAPSISSNRLRPIGTSIDDDNDLVLTRIVSASSVDRR